MDSRGTERGEIAQAHELARHLARWGEGREWRGSDPYEGLSASRRITAPLKRTALGRRLLIQAVKRSPVDLRPMLGIGAKPDAASVAWVVSAYSRDGLLDPDEAEGMLTRALDLLDELRSPGYEEPCWGYHFDFQSRVFFYRRGEPNTIATAFAGHALLDAYDATGDARLLDEACGAGRFFRRYVPLTHTDSGAYFGYLRGDASPIHNSSMLVASLLARLAARGRDDDGFSSAAEAAVRYTATRQRPDGSWPYGEQENLVWVDNFHTGYVLDALRACADAGVGTAEAEEAWARGLAYYRRELFLCRRHPEVLLEQGLPDRRPVGGPGNPDALDRRAARRVVRPGGVEGVSLRRASHARRRRIAALSAQAPVVEPRRARALGGRADASGPHPPDRARSGACRAAAAGRTGGGLMREALADPARPLDRDSSTGGRGLRRRVSFVTDIPTPYMLEVLTALADVVDLTVLFCSQTASRGMPWDSRDELPFDHEVIEGLALRGGAPDRPDYYLSPRVLTALARHRPEAVVSFGFSIPTMYAAAYCRIRRSPLIIYSDGTSHYESRLGRHQLVARAVLLRAASACVAKSKPAVERFVELGARPDRVFLAPHSSTLDRLWRIARDREYGTNGSFTVLTAGRLVAHKGVDKLLLAAAAARSEHPEIKVVVVGSGPEEQRLRGLATRLGVDAEFAGFVGHREMPERFAQADAFAFPTLDDPFGIVLLEAAAAGLPLVASPHGGATRDLIDDRATGLVVDPLDTRAMAAALTELAEDPARRKSLGQAAHSATLGRSPADSAQGYVSAIETAIRSRGRAKP